MVIQLSISNDAPVKKTRASDRSSLSKVTPDCMRFIFKRHRGSI